MFRACPHSFNSCPPNSSTPTSNRNSTNFSVQNDSMEFQQTLTNFTSLIENYCTQDSNLTSLLAVAMRLHQLQSLILNRVVSINGALAPPTGQSNSPQSEISRPQHANLSIKPPLSTASLRLDEEKLKRYLWPTFIILSFLPNNFQTLKNKYENISKEELSIKRLNLTLERIIALNVGDSKEEFYFKILIKIGLYFFRVKLIKNSL